MMHRQAFELIKTSATTKDPNTFKHMPGGMQDKKKKKTVTWF